MSPSTERVCVAAALLAGLIVDRCLDGRPVPQALACRAEAVRGLGEAALTRVAWPGGAPRALRAHRHPS